MYGDRRLTFRELDERATRLAHYLQSQGVGAGDHVGLYLYNCNEYLEGALAAFKLGASPVNINFRYVEEELRYLFDDADLDGAHLPPRVRAARRRRRVDKLPTMKTLIVVEDGARTATAAQRCARPAVEYEAAIRDQSPTRDFGERSGDDVYLLYTGGTTGHAEGRHVAARGRVLRRAAGRQPRRPRITEPGAARPERRGATRTRR